MCDIEGQRQKQHRAIEEGLIGAWLAEEPNSICPKPNHSLQDMLLSMIQPECSNHSRSAALEHPSSNPPSKIRFLGCVPWNPTRSAVCVVLQAKCKMSLVKTNLLLHTFTYCSRHYDFIKTWVKLIRRTQLVKTKHSDSARRYRLRRIGKHP